MFPGNEKPPTEVDGRPRTPGAGVRYEMTMTRDEKAVRSMNGQRYQLRHPVSTAFAAGCAVLWRA
jgi:hypothetical protein